MAAVGWSTEQTKMKIRSMDGLVVLPANMSHAKRYSFYFHYVSSQSSAAILKTQLSTDEQQNKDSGHCNVHAHHPRISKSSVNIIAHLMRIRFDSS